MRTGGLQLEYQRAAVGRDDQELPVCQHGDGFDAELLGQCTHQLRGIGLASMRKRVEATGGQLALDSAPNKGARVGATWNLPSRAGPS